MHGDGMTVTGCTMAENLNCVARNPDQDVVRAADHPLMATEAAVGGPTVLMHDDDDIIATDGERGSLRVQLRDAELEQCRATWQSRQMAFGSGYLWKFAQQIGPARHGAVTHAGGAAEKACYADI
jgi:dihydroxyacid dehydratase/phosphogluconate dehydratase